MSVCAAHHGMDFFQIVVIYLDEPHIHLYSFGPCPFGQLMYRIIEMPFHEKARYAPDAEISHFIFAIQLIHINKGLYDLVRFPVKVSDYFILPLPAF